MDSNQTDLNEMREAASNTRKKVTGSVHGPWGACLGHLKNSKEACAEGLTQ